MLEAKHIIFFGGSAITLPIGIFLAASSRRALDFVFVFLVFGTSMPAGLFGFPTDINFLSREWYRGTTTGIEVSYLDLLAVILLVGSLATRQREGKPLFWPPTLGLLLAYFGWCALTVVVNDPKIFGLFELTKIARAIVLVVAVCAYIRSPREIHLFVWALAGTIFYEALICLRDRYVHGVYRVRGTLAHPNSLSMYCLQCVPIFIGAMFARNTHIALRVVCILAFTAAAGCVLLSVSRTGFAALIVVSGAGFALSTGLRITPRNVVIGLVGAVLISLMVLKSYDTIMERLGGFDLEQEYLSDEGDRGSYFRMASPAIADRPLTGVGLNNWSWAISGQYGPMAGFRMLPYLSTDGGPGGGWQVAPAHNLFLITLTEVGVPGLVLFLLFLLQALWISGISVIRKREQLLNLVWTGTFLSLCGVLMQSWTEWEFRQTSMFFLGHIVLGVSASLYHYLRKA
ncbi:MAG: O-antigen ligase family protein [Candidatus Hydrogenedentes bacterium]|nr:O-antigen ligase family protein [Candidatus Hydrogenedentota bacterium]